MNDRLAALALALALSVLASCADDGSPSPTATPTSAGAPTATSPPTRSATASATAVFTATQPPSPTATTPVPTASPTDTPELTPTEQGPSPTATNTPASDESMTPTPTPTERPCTPTLTHTLPPPGSPTPTFFGPTPRFLTHFEPTPPETVVDYWPRFSPDGETILFTRTLSEQPKSFLVTVPSAGGEAVEFPPPGPTRTPLSVSATRNSWSWNTSLTEHQIAFSGSQEGEGTALYLISEDGSDLAKVEPSGIGTIVDYPSWYPDGTHVAVVDYSAAGGPVLREVDTIAQTQLPLTDNSEVLAGEPAVSRDGTRIAFPGQIQCHDGYDQNDNHIYLLDLASKEVSSFDDEQGRTPDWSPDDAFLAYETTRYCPNGNYAIIIQNVANKTAIQATACEYDGNHPVWSPDGATIAFSAVVPGSENRSIATIPVPELSEVRGFEISGTVHSFGCEGQWESPLPVSLFGVNYQRSTTTTDGSFSFGNVPPGSYTVTFDQSGCGNAPCFDDQAVEITDQNVPLDVCFQLCPAPRLQPDFGRPGTSVEVIGRCYFIHSGGQADLIFGDQVVGQTSHADTSGNYTGTFEVPLNPPLGVGTYPVAIGAAPENTVNFTVIDGGPIGQTASVAARAQ